METTQDETPHVELDDSQCQSKATELLTRVTGASPENLWWDPTHHLQGHATCDGRPMVLIATRDAAHCSHLFTLQDWECICRSGDHERAEMLRAYAIRTHARLVQALTAT